jgi:DNA-binding transcriptional ArsR family regulator
VFNQRVDNAAITGLSFLLNQMVEQGGNVSDPLSKVFAALADPTRRDIVARLSAGDATVNAIAAPYDVSLQAVSKHLKVLEDAGLVSRSREAQRRPVHLEAEVFDLMTTWIQRYQGRAEERFARLDAVLAALDEHGDPLRQHDPNDSHDTDTHDPHRKGQAS